MAERRETITRTAQSAFTHAKVIEGGGEFARVLLRLEPLTRGAGFEFSNTASSIPLDLAAGVVDGVHRAAQRGPNGYPVVDFRATLIDGAYHDIDSTPATFATAAEGAFRAALRTAGTIILF